MDRLRKFGVDEQALAPVLVTVISELRQHIESSLSFKREERLAALDDVQQQMASCLARRQSAGLALIGYASTNECGRPCSIVGEGNIGYCGGISRLTTASSAARPTLMKSKRMES